MAMAKTPSTNPDVRKSFGRIIKVPVFEPFFCWDSDPCGSGGGVQETFGHLQIVAQRLARGLAVS